MRSTITRSGLGICAIEADRPDVVFRDSSATRMYDFNRSWHRFKARHNRRVQEILENLGYTPDVLLLHSNAYVNTGLTNALKLEWGANGPGGGTAIGYFGVDNDNTAVTATTTYLHGAAGATAANQIIKAISPAATLSSLTMTGGATFANADFTSGVFKVNKVGLLTTATDAGTGLVDVVGGSGGAGVYAKTFVMDMTGAGTFNATLQLAITAAPA